MESRCLNVIQSKVGLGHIHILIARSKRVKYFGPKKELNIGPKKNSNILDM